MRGERPSRDCVCTKEVSGRETQRYSADMKAATGKFARHYRGTFHAYGAKARGVDWTSERDTKARYGKMLAIVEEKRTHSPVSLLDVGCGYGGLLAYSKGSGYNLAYTGIDIVGSMVNHARVRHADATFVHADFLECQELGTFDYVVCNGIFTQKLRIPIDVMDKLFTAVMRKMVAMAGVGVAFNVMSDYAPRQAAHLYYKSPLQLLDYCIGHFSRRVKIDHSYIDYEFAVYIYK